MEQREPTEKDLKAREQSFEAARKAFHSTWDNFTDSPLENTASEKKQIAALLEPYLAEVFGGNPEDYTVGFFTANDIGGREAIGYKVLSVGMFPRNAQNKPTWSDGIAMRLHLNNHADGTIRWGSRGETYVCVIRHDKRQNYIAKEEEAQAKLMNRHVRNENVDSKDAPDGMASHVEIKKEKEHIPRARPGRPPKSH